MSPSTFVESLNIVSDSNSTLVNVYDEKGVLYSQYLNSESKNNNFLFIKDRTYYIGIINANNAAFSKESVKTTELVEGDNHAPNGQVFTLKPEKNATYMLNGNYNTYYEMYDEEGNCTEIYNETTFSISAGHVYYIFVYEDEDEDTINLKELPNGINAEIIQIRGNAFATNIYLEQYIPLTAYTDNQQVINTKTILYIAKASECGNSIESADSMLVNNSYVYDIMAYEHSYTEPIYTECTFNNSNFAHRF